LKNKLHSKALTVFHVIVKLYINESYFKNSFYIDCLIIGKRQHSSISAKFETRRHVINGEIHEVIIPDGGPLGGKSIDDAFYKFLSEICGRSVMEELKTTELELVVFHLSLR
jgi:hypothetical protein